jgi:hypothetical protein
MPGFHPVLSDIPSEFTIVPLPVALLESASPADRSATLLALLQIDSRQDEHEPRRRRAS